MKGRHERRRFGDFEDDDYDDEDSFSTWLYNNKKVHSNINDFWLIDYTAPKTMFSCNNILKYKIGNGFW